jgi:flagellar hook-length control protein FliK
MPGKICRDGKSCRVIASHSRVSTMMQRGRTCLGAPGTLCRSITPGESGVARKSRATKLLFAMRGMARGLLTKLRNHLDEPMTAQPLLTTGAKPPARQPQQRQQPSPNSGGFQSLLSTTDSSLMDLGAGAATTHPGNLQAAANSNRPKSNDPNATPYVAVPTPPAAPGADQPSQPTTALPADGKALDANGLPNNLVIPATDIAASETPNDQSGKPNSTAFGADTLNARIVAGAPIYASQPNASIATVPPHLLDAANTHPLPGEPGGKPGDAPNGKAPTDANALLPPSTANAATTPALDNHPASPGTPNANPTNDDKSLTSAHTTDNGATPTSNDPSPSASLLAQPNQPQSAPIQADAAVHTAAPYAPVGEQVALNLKQAIAADNNEIRIQLKPASLGTIDVKLNVGQDGRINAVISADRSDTLNMLKQDAGTLQQALRDVGLNADGSSLSFNLRSDAQSFAQNWSQDGGSGSNSSAYAGHASNSLPGADAVTPAQRLHAGALDIEV